MLWGVHDEKEEGMGLLLLFLANITALCTEAKNAAVRGVLHAVDP